MHIHHPANRKRIIPTGKTTFGICPRNHVDSSVTLLPLMATKCSGTIQVLTKDFKIKFTKYKVSNIKFVK